MTYDHQHKQHEQKQKQELTSHVIRYHIHKIDFYKEDLLTYIVKSYEILNLNDCEIAENSS